MKTHQVPSTLFRHLLAFALLALAGPVVHAQTPSLVFNFDNQNSALYGPNGTLGDVYYMFAQGNSNFSGTYFNGTSDQSFSLTQSGGTYFSPSFSSTDLHGQGFNITEANSTILYVSYGSALNVTQGSPNPVGSGDPNIGTRWQPIEFTFAPGTGNQSTYGTGGGDLTAINVFSIPMQVTAVEDGNKTVGFTNGTTTTSVLNSITSVLGTSAPLSIMHSDISNNTGNFVRAVAPNSFGQGTSPFYASPPAPNLYTADPNGGYGVGQNHSWSTALGQLQDNMTNHGQTVPLTGNTAYKDSVMNVFYAYNFTPTVTNGTAGNYTITFTGNIDYSGYFLPNITNNGTTPAITPGTYSNLTFTMAQDRVTVPGSNNMELSAAVYQQVFTNLTIANISGNNTTVANGTVFSPSWGNVGTLQPSLQSQIELAMQQRVWGDFSEELLLGFLFNPNTANISSGDLFPATPNATTTYYQYAYTGNLTTDQYNEFGKVIWDATNGTIYANPYDDRFGNNLLGVGTNVTTAHWNVTLLPDTAIPEPADAAVLVAVSSLAACLYYRRKRQSLGHDANHPA